MIKAHVQYPLNEKTYQKIFDALGKRHYKITSIAEGYGMVFAKRKFIFSKPFVANIKVYSPDDRSTVIEVTVNRKNISSSKDEQKLADTIYKYF